MKKSKSFSKLEKVWYKKLRKSGFVDIEYDEKNLKQFSGKTSIDRDDGSSKLDGWHKMGATTSIRDHWKFNYYQRARDFLRTYEFKNKTERKIFEMHSEGIGIRVIAKELRTYRRKIHELLQALIKEMKK